MPNPPDTAAAVRRPRWGRWALGAAAVLGLALGTALLLLDPWLRQTAEKQVAERSHGQYILHIGSLHTHLWSRSLTLRQLTLRPAAPLADSLPRIRLSLARLDLSGLGLWALLRKQVVPVDSLALDSLQLEAQAARRPRLGPQLPLHQQLPLQLPGIRLGRLALRHCRAALGPAAAPLLRWQQADLVARDLLLSAAGAADTQRLAYAAAWQLRVQQGAGRAGGHGFTVRNLHFSSAAGSLRLDSLRVRPPAPGQGQAGALRVRLRLPQLLLGGWQVAAMQHGQHFRADSLVLLAPDLTFWPPDRQPPPLWQLLRPVLRRGDLARLYIRNATLRVEGLGHAPEAHAIFVSSSNLRIDSLASADWRRVAYARAWTARTGRLSATFDAPFYRASVAHLYADTDAKTLLFSDLRLAPVFSAAQMNRRRGYQTSQISARLPELRLRQVNYPLLAHKSRLQVGRLRAVRPWVQIASDGRGPINPHRSIIAPEALRSIGLPLTVSRLDIANGCLEARYRSPKSPLVGRIRIGAFSGSLRNVSSDPARAGTALTGTATALLQGRCRMQVRLRVPLGDAQGRHRIWGSFGPAPFAILNPMTVPTRLVQFSQGQVRRIQFDMHVNQERIDGTMQAEYTGLKLGLPKYKNGELQEPLLAKIGSGLVNKLIIRDENPRPSGRLVPGRTTSGRELRFSVFVLWRQGLISGLLHSAGVPQGLAQKFSEAQDTGPLP